MPRLALSCAAALALLSAPSALCDDGAAAARIAPKAAFERLKALAGAWKGHVTAEDGPEATVRWELISGKTAVMETLFPGSDHEMRSVYYMDGPDLVLTHYCVMGNQPRMRLARASTADELVFEFAGGSNLDASRDAHVHEGRIRLVDADHLEAEWRGWADGKPAHANRFFLARAR